MSIRLSCTLLLAASLAGAATWAPLNPLPTSQNLSRIASRPGLALAVGGAGTVVRSTDGRSWGDARGAAAVELRDIAVQGDRFWVVGDSGTILTSLDGTTWEARPSGVAGSLRGIAASDRLLVAVGDSGTIVSSEDGVRWSLRAGGDPETLHDVVWTGSRFVAVGGEGLVRTSTDGTTWERHSSGAENTLYAVAWTGTTLVAGGFNLWAYNCYGTLLSSSDGASWTTLRDGSTREIVQDIATTSRGVVVVGYDGIPMVSTDLQSWTKGNPASTRRLRGVASCFGILVTVGESGTLATSEDGTTWTLRSSSLQTDLDAVVWTTPDRFLAVGAGGRTLAGRADSLVAGTTTTSRELTALAVFQGVPVAGGAFAPLQSSPGGESWTSALQGSDRWVRALAQDGSTLVAVGDGGGLLSSTDGRTWIPGVSGTSRSLLGLTRFQGHWIAVGQTGTIRSSADLAVWDSAASGTNLDLLGVAGSPSTLVAVGKGGTILRSSDGSLWRPQVSGTTGTLRAVAWTGRDFVAAGDAGTILRSIDGATWLPDSSGIRTDLRAIASTSGSTVIVGTGGTVLLRREGTESVSPTAPARPGRIAWRWRSGGILSLQPTPDAAGPLQGEILGMDGRFLAHLYPSATGNGILEADLSRRPAGAYLVRVRGGNRALGTFSIVRTGADLASGTALSEVSIRP